MQKERNGAVPRIVSPPPNKYVTGAGTRCIGPCFSDGTVCGEYTICPATVDQAETSPATLPGRRLEAIA